MSNNKKTDFKKMALLGITGGVLLASQGLNANDNFTFNANIDNIVAASCGGGTGNCGGSGGGFGYGGGGYYSQPQGYSYGQPQNSCGYSQPQGYSYGQPQNSCGYSQPQGYSYGQPQGSCGYSQPHGGYSYSHQQQDGWHGQSYDNSYSNYHQAQSGCGGSGQHNTQHPTHEYVWDGHSWQPADHDHHLTAEVTNPNQPTTTSPYDRQTNPQTQWSTTPSNTNNPTLRPGQTIPQPQNTNPNLRGTPNSTTNPAIKKSTDTTTNPQAYNSTNSHKYVSDAGKSATADHKTLTESELVDQLNPQSKALFKNLSPEGKTLALKLANQDCKGHNDCKGLNSCKSDENSCAGQGGCKGKSVGPFTDKNVAVKVAALKMAEKRAKADSTK